MSCGQESTFSFEKLSEKIIRCRRCPRLVKFRETAPARASFRDEIFWRKPNPGFGDSKAWLLILGLAPAPQGGNRTGRIFTGDPSGTFLMKNLYRAGLANQPTSESRSDGLELFGCFITAAVKCTPPKHQPLAEEFFNCSSYFENEFLLLDNLKAVLALGKSAFDTYLRFLKKNAHIEMKKKPVFSHGQRCTFCGWPDLYGSFHPSPQNTYTGKLTDHMFQDLLLKIQKEHSKK